MADETARGRESARGHECPKKQHCPLFPLFQNQSNLRVWQTLFCNQRFDDCARFKLASSGVRPDDDLLPNGTRLRRSETPA